MQAATKLAVFIGRKRKSRSRQPSGKIKAVEDKTDPKIIAFRMPHRLTVPEAVRHDPKAECWLGRYQLQNQITEWEYRAGVWYRGVVNRYRVVLSAPNPSAASNAGVLVPVFGASPEVLSDDETERRTSAYNQAFDVLDSVSKRAARAVARVAVYDEKCPEGCWELLRLGLLALAVHRGFITERMAKAIDIRGKT
jgi:hypothetical protein